MTYFPFRRYEKSGTYSRKQCCCAGKKDKELFDEYFLSRSIALNIFNILLVFKHNFYLKVLINDNLQF